MRRRKAKKIEILPDPKFKDTQVTKFVNNLMLDGKKSTAFKIFYDSIDIIDAKLEDQNALEVLKRTKERLNGVYNYDAVTAAEKAKAYRAGIKYQKKKVKK